MWEKNQKVNTFRNTDYLQSESEKLCLDTQQTQLFATAEICLANNQVLKIKMEVEQNY